MNLDPTMNVVVFAPSRGQPFTAAAPARDEDCIQQAWETVKAEHQVRAFDIVAVHSEWQPSDADARFLTATFSNLKERTYTFPRPADDGWDEAFEAARRTMQDAATAMTHAQGTDGAATASGPADPRESATSLDEALRRIAAKATSDQSRSAHDPVDDLHRGGELLPVLRSDTASREMRELLAHNDVTPGLYVSLAYFAMTPRNTIGMNHVLKRQLREPGHPRFSKLLADACANLADGLRLEVRGGDDGAEMVMVTRPDKPASQVSSAIVLPGFYDNIAAHLGDGPLLAAIPCLDNLLVAREGSPAAQQFPEIVQECRHTEEFLLPSLVRIDSSGIELLQEWT